MTDIEHLIAIANTPSAGDNYILSRRLGAIYDLCGTPHSSLATTALIGLLGDIDTRIRKQAALALEKRENNALVIAALSKSLWDTDWQVASNCALVLMELGAVDVLVSALDDSRLTIELLRALTVQLKTIKHPVLQRYVEHPDAFVRMNAEIGRGLREEPELYLELHFGKTPYGISATKQRKTAPLFTKF